MVVRFLGPAVFLLFGLVFLYAAYGNARFRYAYARTETERPGARPLDRAVKLRGVARERDHTHPSPITGEDALLTDYRVDRYDPGADDAKWDKRTDGTHGAPFYLEHEGDRVVVDDGGVSFSFTNDDRLREAGGVYRIGDQEYGRDSRRRFTERSVFPGDEVVVYGSLEPFSGGPDDPHAVVRKGEHSRFFRILSDESALPGYGAAVFLAILGLGATGAGLFLLSAAL